MSKNKKKQQEVNATVEKKETAVSLMGDAFRKIKELRNAEKELRDQEEAKKKSEQRVQKVFEAVCDLTEGEYDLLCAKLMEVVVPKEEEATEE